MSIIAERQSGATEIQGLSAGSNCMTTTLSKEKKRKEEEAGYYPRAGGNSIYRGGDFVGRVMRQGLVGSVQVALDGLWGEVE